MADSTPSTTPVDLPAAELRDTIAGEVVTPDDPSYEQLRFAAYHEGRPAVVVRCSTHDDIRQAVQFARAHDLPLSVRGGGHSGAGFGTNEGGLVVELSQFDAVEVLDAERGLVRVGAGAKWGAVADALAPHGLAITSGDTRSVGVSGLTLGGGIGWFVRQFGLTVDVLVTAEILLADGQVVRASADDNAELFWALRGGGGNFGVVTAFEFWAAPIRQVLVGTFAYPRAEAAAVLKSWRDHMRSAPDELNATAMVMPEIPGGPPQFSLTVCVPADDEQAARALVEPFRQFGSVDGESLRVVAYPDALEDPPHPPPGFEPVGFNSFFDDLSDDAIDQLVQTQATVGAMMVQLRSLGGAYARVSADATAVAQRGAEAVIMAARFSPAPDAVAAFSAMQDALLAVSAGAYGNFSSTNTDDELARIYPEPTRARLAAAKAVYDPDNVFRRNFNITPAAG